MSVKTKIAAENLARPIAWQVGRHGEVAGGMTQVVNGYLAWQFSNFDVRVIVSRDGSRGFRALALFVRALMLLVKLNDVQKNMFVVHLSQGGSFIREGFLLLLAQARGFGTVAHIHGSRFVDFAGRHPWLVKKILSVATKVVVLSDATRDVIVQIVPPSRVELVPNAVPEGQVQPKERLIVFGGAVSRRKGVDVLIEAWRKAGVGSGWQLVIAGPIADPGLIPGNLPDAKFLGAITHDALMDLLEQSSIAVLPSRDEAMPMFILEALARDNCMISTRVGGIPAVLAHGRGLLVDVGDTDQLAAALKKVISDDVFRERTTQAGRAGFDDAFSAKAIFPRIENIWLDVLMNPSTTTETLRPLP